jgi:hypothetical protein
MKKILFPLTIILLSYLVSAFSFNKTKKKRHYTIQPNVTYTVSLYEDDADFIPSFANNYIGFKEAVAFKESQGNYFVLNGLGYMGKYQFGKSTLATLRITNSEYFLYSPQLQEKAFKANCRYNKWALKKEIEKYAGSTIKGIKITESGILAAAHLSGAGSVRKFLRHQGKNKKIVDSYGTTIEHYLEKFSGYNLSSLQATKRPRL